MNKNSSNLGGLFWVSQDPIYFGDMVSYKGKG